MRREQEHALGEARTGSQERIELAGLLKFIDASEGDEDSLAGFAVLARVLDDLEVLPGPGLFDAEEHGGLVERDTAILASKSTKSRTNPEQINQTVAPHFGTVARKKSKNTGFSHQSDDFLAPDCRKRVKVNNLQKQIIALAFFEDAIWTT
jgi:hypothetical protein